MSELQLLYQRDIYTEFISSSGLLILGEGLGAWDLLRSFIECYADPKLLVFILGLDPDEESFLLDKFTAGEHQLVGRVPFNVVKNDTLGPERVRIYAGGGVISITSRIMLTDLLSERLPAFLTTGICLFRAERLTEHCLEAFILHLYRERNQDGFIKGISEALEPFTFGFNQLEKMMKWMRVPNNLLLYPRFHSLVKEELDVVGMEVEELVLRPNQRTMIVQMALVDLIGICLKELVRLNPFLETVKLGQEGESMATLDGLLGRQFDVLVKQQLEPVWHQIGFRTRQLVSELSTLRSLLHSLFAFDAVTFLRYLETILDTEVSANGPFGTPANWIVLDSAHTLIQVSRDRVYTKDLSSPVLEEPAKWKALLDLLRELEEEETILVMTDSESTRKQVELLVTHGVKPLVQRYFENYRAWKAASKSSTVTSSSSVAKRWPSREKLPSVKDVKDETEGQKQQEEMGHGDLEELEVEAEALGRIHVRAYQEHNLDLLETVKPTAVIMYTQNLSFIRSLELYTATSLPRGPSSTSVQAIKVYSIYHKDSTEEQAYLLSIRREKNAFEALIKAKANMVLPQVDPATSQDDEAGGEQNALLGRLTGRSVALDESSSTRKLIVDVRELRSSLPFILHKTGAFTLVPETISIGDYLLTPDCAVERKAIPDLIQSLASGRLYTQSEALCRTYKQPMLLIEFDETRRAFSLLGAGELRSEISGTDLISRLCLLLLHFPKLKLIWSSSLLATAEIFADLQRDQPDPLSPHSDLDLSSSLEEGAGYNVTPKAMLEAMPGVNQQNLYKLMNACGSIKQLCSMDCTFLQELMGEANGKALHDFLHTNLP